LELSNSETVRFLTNLSQNGVIWMKDFIKVLTISKTTYSELFKTGEIQSMVEGEKVVINLKANVCGDILIFICPKDEYSIAGTDIMNLIATDNQIEQQKTLAIKTLKQKHEALIALPIIISSLINILFILVSYIFTADSIYELFHQNYDPNIIKDLWPWILIVFTLKFGKSIGFKIVSIFI